MNKADNTYILRYAKKFIAIDALGGHCQDCGEYDIVVLEFHHKTDKDYGLSGAFQNKRWSDIEKEIDKCSLLCANCHATTYVSTARTKKFKKRLFDIFGRSDCVNCGYDGLGLSFHHKDGDKEFNFANLVARKVSVTPEQLISELDKCSLMCRNCHAKEHFDFEKFNLFLPMIKKRVIEYKECPPMVDRQKVLDLVAEGHSKAAVARMVGCAKSTISYITNG